MKTMRPLHRGTVALCALMPLLMLSSHAQAQQQGAVQPVPRIEGFNVDEVRRLAAGVDLNFGIYGTPGGIATLRIDGAARNLALTEVEPGRYEGVYTISTRDKITARSPVTANLRVGNQVASTVLNETLQTGVGYHPAKVVQGMQPRIAGFSVEPAASLGAGNDLRFLVSGTPGGKVELTIGGMKGRLLLPETSRGEYAATYTIRSRDRIAPDSVVTANLRVGELVTAMNLGKSLRNASAPAARAPQACPTCGTVEAVNLVEVKGEGNYLGTIGGGVIGALLGSQVGGGNGRTAAEVAGALGGAYAGHTIEGNMRKTTHYEVAVRLQTGLAQTVAFPTEPGYRVGDRVKITDGVIARAQ